MNILIKLVNYIIKYYKNLINNYNIYINYSIIEKKLKGENIIFVSNFDLPNSDKLFFKNGFYDFSNDTFNKLSHKHPTPFIIERNLTLESIYVIYSMPANMLLQLLPNPLHIVDVPP